MLSQGLIRGLRWYRAYQVRILIMFRCSQTIVHAQWYVYPKARCRTLATDVEINSTVLSDWHLQRLVLFFG